MCRRSHRSHREPPQRCPQSRTIERSGKISSWQAPLLSLVLACTLSTSAPTSLLANPRIVDLNTTPEPVRDLVRYEVEGVELLGEFLFAATDETHGAELWISDGTVAGTSLFADLNPGPASSSPRDFLQVGEQVFFVATSHEHGREIWSTLLASTSPTMVLDLAPGSASSEPRDLRWDGAAIYFSAETPESGRELWRWDGMSVTTPDLVDGAGGSDPEELVADPSGGVFFVAETPETGRELFRSDGTPGGTLLVGDLLDGPGSSDPTELVWIGTKLAFRATFDHVGRELGVFDPQAGALEIHDVNAGANSSNPSNLLSVGSTRLYFQADDGSTGDELWRYHESTAVVQRLTDLMPGSGDGVVSGPMTSLEGRVYFAGTDPATGSELYRYGPLGGVSLVADLYPGTPGSLPSRLRTFGDVLVFGALFENEGQELAISDGTAAGTSLLTDIVPGSGASTPTPVARVADLILVSSFDPERDGVLGSASLTGEWTDLSASVEESSSRPEILVGDSQGAFAFAATTPELGTELWIADRSGVRLVHDVAPGSNSYEPRDLLLRADGRLVATNSSSSIVSSEPLVWDGSTIHQINLNESGHSEPRGLHAVGELVLTEAENASGQRVLWALDPTALTAEQLTTERTYDLVASCGIDALFLIDDQLWRTDGTALGTQLVTTAPDGAFWAIHALCDGGEADTRALLAYQSTDGDTLDLWASDGTAAGTLELMPGFDTSRGLYFEMPHALSASPSAPRQGRVLLSTLAAGSTHRELVVTDGTPAGTLQLTSRELDPDADPDGLYLLAPLQDGWLLQDTRGDTGAEPWFSDGTVAGTRLLEVVAGPVGSRPNHLSNPRPYRGAQVSDVAVLSLFTPERGFELWTTDGTLAGTLPLAELWPGVQGEALDLVASGDRVLAAGHGPNGEGLELVVWEKPLFADGFDSGGVSGWSQTSP